MEEEWRDIKGYENLYQVSNKGQIKSLGNGKSNNSFTHVERIMKAFLTEGYLKVRLCKNGKTKSFLVHRLVAESFLPNPDNLPCVNHKSEKKTENNVENLEFCSYQYNNNYGTRKQRAYEKQKITNSKRKPIKCLDLQTNEISYYTSINETARQFNVHSTIIWRSIYRNKSPYKKRYLFTEL